MRWLRGGYAVVTRWLRGGYAVVTRLLAEWPIVCAVLAAGGGASRCDPPRNELGVRVVSGGGAARRPMQRGTRTYMKKWPAVISPSRRETNVQCEL